jgi:hypothetical protein
MAAAMFNANCAWARVTPGSVLPPCATPGSFPRHAYSFSITPSSGFGRRIPADKLSRVSSYDWMVSLALLPLGYVLAGPLAQAPGAVEVLIGGSALACLALAAGLLPSETRTLERLAAHISAEGAATEPLPGLAHRT